MATLSIYIADANLEDVLEAIGSTYHYQAKLPGGMANPETKVVFAERMLAHFVMGIYMDHKSQRAREVARGEAATAATIRSATEMEQEKPKE